MILRKIFLHFFMALVLTGIIIWLVLSMLSNYTRHGEVFVVPDFTGEDHERVIRQYSDQFTFIISDSLFKQGAVLGSVLQQEPPAGSKVKQGRNIYLVTVAKQPEKVRMPNLLNLSLREALVTMESAGLEVNEIQIAPHFARFAVVSQKYHGSDIEAGSMLFRGASIDLVVGDGGEAGSVAFPMVFGKHASEARRALHVLAINIGRESFPQGTDSTKAMVYRVEPYFKPGAPISPGSYVNLLYQSPDLTDFDKFVRDSLYLETPDTATTETYEENYE